MASFSKKSKVNNSGQIKLNWENPNKPTNGTGGVTANVPEQIPLNTNYILSSFPTTTYPVEADVSIGGDNVIDPSTLKLRELKAGQNAIYRVNGFYINKGSGNNGSIAIRLYNPDSSFQLTKDVGAPDGTTSFGFNLTFDPTADANSLDPGRGYLIEIETSFSDGNFQVIIDDIQIKYLACENYVFEP